MKILYYDCFSGISGDMNLGALLDLGVDRKYFLTQLGLLGLEKEYEIDIRTEQRKGITGTRVEIILKNNRVNIKGSFSDHSEHHNHEKHNNYNDDHDEPYNKNHDIQQNIIKNLHKSIQDNLHENIREIKNVNKYKNINVKKHKIIHENKFNEENISNKMQSGKNHNIIQGRKLNDIERVVFESNLSDSIKSKSMFIFNKLAEAEAKVHGIAKEEVHFHEVGATDAIIDIVGAAICLEYLQVDKILSSSVELGGGLVRCEHGLLPVPVPAVVELLKGIPVKTGGGEFETTTPTGAALLSSIVDMYCDKISYSIEKIGYGIGKRDSDLPNALRVYLGEMPETMFGEVFLSGQGKEDSLADRQRQEGDQYQVKEIQWMLETNIDDMNPEIFQYVEEKLYAEGALDVYKTPVIMKKGRPAVKLSVLSSKAMLEKLKTTILLETTAIGLRCYEVTKTMLNREIKEIETKYGLISVKCAYIDDRLLKYKAEYEDCKRLAYENEIPIREIYKEIENCMFILSEVHTISKL